MAGGRQGKIRNASLRNFDLLSVYVIKTAKENMEREIQRTLYAGGEGGNRLIYFPSSVESLGGGRQGRKTKDLFGKVS